VNGQLSVDLADLREWADQVGRAGRHCRDLAAYHQTCVPDGDFGRILAPIRPEYELCAVQTRDALAVAAVRLDDTGSALLQAAQAYARTDSRAAHRFGSGAGMVGDGPSGGAFHDRGVTAPQCPTSHGLALPELTFGWSLDEVVRLAQHAWGWDIRAEITGQITGDVGRALTQAEAWDNAGAALAVIGHNVAHGATAVTATWEGDAWTSSHHYALDWIRALDALSRGMTRAAHYLRDTVALAVQVAQVVVDVFRELAYIVTAGIGFANVPIYGELRAIKALRDVWRLLNDARKVLQIFWQALVIVKDTLRALAIACTAESLPPAPRLPAPAPPVSVR
jgi:hypothetical protein